MRTTKHFLLFILVLALVATPLCSCEALLSKLSPLTGTETTTPTESTPEATTPEVTTPEVTTPEVTTPEDRKSVV